MMKWLISLPPYQNVMFSLWLSLFGIVAVIWVCAWVFKKMDEVERRERDEARMQEQRKKRVDGDA